MPARDPTTGRFLAGSGKGSGGGSAVGWTVRTRDDVKKILRKVKKTEAAILFGIGGYVRKVARHSIKRSRTPGPAGGPVRTRFGLAKTAILFAVERDDERVTIGPSYEIIGQAMMGHEHGIRFRGEETTKRPTMGPALEESLPEYRRMWRNSIV